MTHQQSRKLFYVLRRIIGRIIPAVYVLYVSGIFTNGVTQESLSMSIWIVVAWLVWTFAMDFIKSSLDEDEIKPKRKGFAEGLKNILPWLLIFLVATGIRIGISNLYEHLMFIVGCQIGGSVAYGYETYHKWEIRKGVNTP
jgi:small-conductance mechanosensitive channel